MPVRTDSLSSRLLLRSILAAGVAILLFVAAHRARGDDFSETRLAEGTAALAAGNYREAAERLRVASFGLLDQPARLANALARLAVADEAAGRHDEARGDVTRLLAVEERFAVFASVRLEPQQGATLRRLLAGVPAAELASAPALAAFARLPRTAAPEPPGGVGDPRPVPTPIPVVRAIVPAEPVGPAPVAAPPDDGAPPALAPDTVQPPSPAPEPAAPSPPAPRAGFDAPAVRSASAPAPAPEAPPGPGDEWLERARAAARAGDAKETIRMADRALDAAPHLAEAKALRAHARAARYQCRGALHDIEALGEDAQRFPELAADRFVCLVDKERFDEARAAAAAVPAALGSRADVVKARSILARERPGAAPPR